MESGRKMGEDRGGFREVKEKLYRSRRTIDQFFQTLAAGYHQQLAIPQKFLSNLKEKLAGDVKLRGPSEFVWTVGITTTDNSCYFKDGWKEFVEDHSLEENDVLIFKYSANSLFDVMIFDHKSLCEKESPYVDLVKRCVNENAETVRNEERKEEKSPPPPVDEVSKESSGKRLIEEVTTRCAGKAEVVSNEERKEEKSPRPPPQVFEVPSDESSHEMYECGTMKRRRKDDVGTTSGGQSLHTNTKKRSKRNGGTSNVTEEANEKLQKVVDKAEEYAAKSEAPFVIIMQRTHLGLGAQRRLFLNIPAKWSNVHIKPTRSQCKKVILQLEEKTWQVGLYRRADGNYGLQGGWKNFVVENCLEVSDVLAFNLVTATPDTITLNVRIFRLADTPPPPPPRVIVGGKDWSPKKQALGNKQVEQQ